MIWGTNLNHRLYYWDRHLAVLLDLHSASCQFKVTDSGPHQCLTRRNLPSFRISRSCATWIQCNGYRLSTACSSWCTRTWLCTSGALGRPDCWFRRTEITTSRYTVPLRRFHFYFDSNLFNCLHETKNCLNYKCFWFLAFHCGPRDWLPGACRLAEPRLAVAGPRHSNPQWTCAIAEGTVSFWRCFCAFSVSRQ